MSRSSRVFYRSHSAPTFVALLAFVAGGALTGDHAIAQGTHLWQQSQMEEFEKGTPQGVSIESDGHLRQGPELTELVTTPSSFVWSLAVDKKGTVFAGTGSPATVLRLGSKPGEKPFVLFETRDLSVQALLYGDDGALYAATVPSGRVYKLDPNATTKQDESNATVIFDAAKPDAAAGSSKDSAQSSQAHYIWDLIFGSAGLYIATGNPGAVYRVDPAKPSAVPEVFFKSDEAHIRNLAWDGKGNLIAGSDGSGLVYRIDSTGKGYVLFEAPRREITSIAIGANGTIYAACVGDKSRNPLPPLPVQGVSSITITVVQPQSVQAANASASVPEGTEIFALREGQAPRSLWSSKDSIVYRLAARPDGLLAFSGNRGQIFRIQDNGSYADVGHLQAQQGLSVAPMYEADGIGQIYVGTGNIGKVFELGRQWSASETHEYASDVLDAGAFARFGRVEIEPGSTGYDILTRSGNVEQPVRGWSDWQALADGAVASPPGRFLQWKAVLHNGGILGSVGVNYLPVNSAPVVDEMVVVPGARISQQINSTQGQSVSITLPSSNQGSTITYDANSSSQPLQAAKDRTAVTVRWAAHDDDGDSLVYSLYLQGDGDSAWWPLKRKIKDTAFSFDASLIPDGGYRIKVVASDAPSHSPGEALTGEKVSDRFVVDTTPPVVSAIKVEPAPVISPCALAAQCSAAWIVNFDADDAASPIARAEYSIDAGPWQTIDPVGKLSDAKHEHYSFSFGVPVENGKPAEHLITVRAYDRYDNVGVGKTIFPVQGQ